MHDSAKPDNFAETSVTIPVRRNVHAPSFLSQTYAQTIFENLAVGSSVLQVNATDDDNVSVFIHVI